jgi:hypothetical protein
MCMQGNSHTHIMCVRKLLEIRPISKSIFKCILESVSTHELRLIKSLKPDGSQATSFSA